MPVLGAGDVILVNFPGVTGVKRRPAVVLSSDEYHAARPDVIIGLITSQIPGTMAFTDHSLHDWAQAGLRVPSVFRSFVVTLPRSAQQTVVGHLSVDDWQAVCACVKRSLASPVLQT